MSLAQELMLRITGYTDKCSVRPGDEVSFHIHSELNESYDVQMVRLIHGDTNPEGPGFKERLLRSPTNGKYRGQRGQRGEREHCQGHGHRKQRQHGYQKRGHRQRWCWPRRGCAPNGPAQRAAQPRPKRAPQRLFALQRRGRDS